MKAEDIKAAKTSDLLLAMNLERMKYVILSERADRQAEELGWRPPPGTWKLGMSDEAIENHAIRRLEAVADEIDRRIPVPKDGG